jgi:hypothetical protein
MNDCDRDLIYDENGSCDNKYKEQLDKYNKHRKQQPKPIKVDSFPSEYWLIMEGFRKTIENHQQTADVIALMITGFFG